MKLYKYQGVLFSVGILLTYVSLVTSVHTNFKSEAARKPKPTASLKKHIYIVTSQQHKQEAREYQARESKEEAGESRNYPYFPVQTKMWILSVSENQNFFAHNIVSYKQTERV